MGDFWRQRLNASWEPPLANSWKINVDRSSFVVSSDDMAAHKGSGAQESDEDESTGSAAVLD
ncbi:hypothetical protein COLO4_33927 [Corchorus olitorius]|uniref:Uncharacterized protein n=1 Tax=Corchorus olitorius TaxID=93759 RepID=A0A1R3GPW1_9ROSI|nr:hypothetical protein COLO4_33927 [Corchorus olitorius]